MARPHPLTIQSDIERQLCKTGHAKDFHLRAAGAIDIDGSRFEVLGIDQEGKRAVYIDRETRNVVTKELDSGWPTSLRVIDSEVDDVRQWVLVADLE